MTQKQFDSYEDPIILEKHSCPPGARGCVGVRLMRKPSKKFKSSIHIIPTQRNEP